MGGENFKYFDPEMIMRYDVYSVHTHACTHTQKFYLGWDLPADMTGWILWHL